MFGLPIALCMTAHLLIMAGRRAGEFQGNCQAIWGRHPANLLNCRTHEEPLFRTSIVASPHFTLKHVCLHFGVLRMESLRNETDTAELPPLQGHHSAGARIILRFLPGHACS